MKHILIDDKIVVNRDGYTLILNQTGNEIFEKFSDGMEETEIIGYMTSKYKSVDRSTLERECREFIEQIKFTRK